MFDHIGLKAKDLPVSIAFYTAALEPLGVRLMAEDGASAGFGQSEPVFWLYAGEPARGAHVAFKAPSRRAVDAFHARAVAAGGTDNGAAGPRPDYGPDYYAAFVTDPDGVNVEAVCLEAAG